MRKTFIKLLALLMALALVAAACGDDENSVANTGETNTTEAAADEPDTDVMSEEATAEGVDAPASALRADLTSLLQEHLYLAGIALEQAVLVGGDLENPTVQAAVATLDENSVALSDAVGSIAGPENGEAFLGLWREHIGFFVDYTLGRATGDQAMADQALTDLAGYQDAAGAFFEEITGGELSQSDVVTTLEEHVATTTAAIDALVAGDPAVFMRLYEAGQHMPMAAEAIAAAIAAALPDDFPGDVSGEAATLRAGLTHRLQEHVYLAGIAIEQAVLAGGDLEAPTVTAALEVLDLNSVALADMIGSVAGDENREAFLGLWREHIGFFADYTLGKATGDQAMVDQALTDLDGYQDAAGAFFEEITGGELTQDDVVAALEEHVSTLTTAIDSLVAGEASVFTELRAAAQHMPMVALANAQAIEAAA